MKNLKFRFDIVQAKNENQLPKTPNSPFPVLLECLIHKSMICQAH